MADLNRSKKTQKRKFYQQHVHLKNRSHAHTHTGVLQKVYGWINQFQQVLIEMMTDYEYHSIPLIHL